MTGHCTECGETACDCMSGHKYDASEYVPIAPDRNKGRTFIISELLPWLSRQMENMVYTPTNTRQCHIKREDIISFIEANKEKWK